MSVSNKFVETLKKLKVSGEVVYQTESLTVNGEASLTVPVCLVSGTSAITLANPALDKIGLVKIFIQNAAGTVTITPATLNGGTTITLNAVGECVTLMYTGTAGWSIIGTSLVSSGGSITSAGLQVLLA